MVGTPAAVNKGDGGSGPVSSSSASQASVVAAALEARGTNPPPPPPTNGPTTGLVGSVRYLSVAAHSRGRQTRRCDLESLAYVLIYLVRVSAEPSLHDRSTGSLANVFVDSFIACKGVCGRVSWHAEREVVRLCCGRPVQRAGVWRMFAAPCCWRDVLIFELGVVRVGCHRCLAFGRSFSDKDALCA